MTKQINKLLLAGTCAALLGLSACGQSSNVSTVSPKNAKEAMDQLAIAEAGVEAARKNLDQFTACAAENILADVSSYTTDMGDISLAQEDWFAANGKRKGVVTTASGLQYSVNKSGDGKGISPRPEQVVRVNYHGLFLNGDKFDSSYDRNDPAEFPLNRVISGWTEGVALMQPCDAWTFYIPSDLAYGPAGRPPTIPKASPLVFHIQLLAIK